jgi:hypothetical protein
MRQHNLRVTGSLTLNGENVVSASQLSALTQTLTGQYATTSSNSYNGNQTITGSVIVTGTITANEFHTTFVTSSVLYTSGSSKFGDTNDDIMEVTGSLKVNGNITANNLNGIVSGSSQLTSSYDTRYVVSGSITQTTWDNIASKPSGIVSASSQVILQSTTGQLSASRVDGLNLTQISSGSYTASIGETFNVNTNTIITGSLSVSSLSGSGVNYLAYSGGIVTAISGTAAIKYNQEFTATLGQTIFTPSVGYVSGLIDVYYNGTKLSATDYTATNGYNISLVQGADLAGDIIEIAIYNPVSGVSNNVLRQQTTFTASVAQTTFTINYTPGLIDVFFNGSRLANEEYTANNGTSIILSEATTGGEILDVFVYSYQVGAFSGVGGSGVLNQLAYWSSQSGLTGSNSLTFDGSTLTISGSLVPAVSGAYDLGSTTKPFRHIYVGSGSIFLVNNEGQVTNTISAQSIVTTDTLNSGTIDLTKSLPTGTVSGSSQIVGILSSLNTATASFTPRITNLESKSASVDISLSSINSKTGSYATTGSNTFFGTQTYSGSVYIANDLVVQGSSSIQYISASSVSIGTNIVQLNTANPTVRFAGLTIIDSGSIGGSGSFLYDSVHDEFVFVHRGNGTNVTSSHFVLGPETYDSLGNELYLTCNIISKGTGKEHLIDSCIFDNGTTTCIKNNLVGTGTISGTTIYGSTAVCSPVGKFTSCIDAGSGIFSGAVTTNANFINSGPVYSTTGNVGNLLFTNTYPSTYNVAQIASVLDGYFYASKLVFRTADQFNANLLVDRLTIASAGNVGIGTCSPSYRLDIANTSAQMSLTATDATGYNEIYFRRNTSTVMGYIGVGVNSTVTANGNEFVIQNNISEGNIVFRTNCSGTIAERMRIIGGGYILIPSAAAAANYFSMNYTTVDARSRQWRIGSDQNQYGDMGISQATTQGGSTFAYRILIDCNGTKICGSLSKDSGSFRIKHPLASKKCTHQLVHSFIEGPTADLIYRGKINLDNGIACVNIDCAARMTEGTFEALNRCAQVFTTNESSWNAIKGKLQGNILVIESQNTESNDEISWMVIGERQDEHMFETAWTDNEGRVITEPINPIKNTISAT